MGNNTSPFLAAAFCYADKSLNKLIGIMMINTNEIGNPDLTKVRQDMDATKVVKVLEKQPNLVSNLALVNGTLKTTNGTMQRYPTFVGNFNTRSCISNAIVVVGEIESVGYRLLDVTSKAGFADLGTASAIQACNNVGIANGKLVTNSNGKTIISSISGNYPKIPIAKSKIALDTSAVDPEKNERETKLKNALDAQSKAAADKLKEKAAEARSRLNNGSDLHTEEAEARDKARDILAEDKAYLAELTARANANAKRNVFAMKLPVVSGVYHSENGKSHYNDVIGTITDNLISDANSRDASGNIKAKTADITIGQKLTAALYNLREGFPFYNAVLSNLGIEELPENSDCKTMCVSPNKLFWYYKFVEKKSIPALIFVLLHECCHNLMRHHSRRGSRDPELWNIATDLYINRSLADELGLETIGVPKPFNYANQDSKWFKVEIPFGVLYNSAIDLKTDTPELIYEELMQELKDAQQKQQQQQGNQQNNQQQQGNDNSSDNTNNDNNNNSNNNEQQNGQQQQNGQSSQQGNQQGGQPQNGSQQNGGNGGSGGQSNDNGNQNGGSPTMIPFRGTLIPYTGNGTKGQQQAGGANGDGDMASGDIVNDEDSAKLSPEQLSDAQMAKAKSIVYGYKLRGGHCNSAAFREIEDIMNAEHRLVNWKSELKRFLSKVSGYENTFARPDRRFISRNSYLPGRTPMDPDSIENLKVCIDTSGSMSDNEIREMLATIADIFKQYKAKAELLYWDTAVRAVYPFENIQELAKAKPAGGGGTDAECIFEYFNTNTDYVRRKKKKPSLIIVLTDGYIGNVNKKYMSKYGSKTIWIITKDGIPEFDAPFGKLATYKPQF